MTANPVRRLLARRPAALSLLLVTVVFAIDLSLPLGVASAVPYTFAVLLALAAKPGWVGPTVALICSVLTIAKIEIVPERGTTEMWKVIANRCLALFAIGMTTALGVLRRRSEARRIQVEETMRERETELARLGRLSLLGQVAAGLAHELNQPLAAICLQADLALLSANEPRPKPDLAVALREIEEQSRRAAEIVRSIRRLAKQNSPGQDAVDLNEAVRTVVRLLDRKAARAAVAIQLALQEVPAPRTPGDRIQLEQVIVNLLENAIEAIVERDAGPRTVRIETKTEDSDTVAIRITDSGLGVAAPSRLFERYYTTKPDGLGLGLAISQAIVEAHSGQLLANPAPGGGAMFAVLLPAHRKETP